MQRGHKIHAPSRKIHVSTSVPLNGQVPAIGGGSNLHRGALAHMCRYVAARAGRRNGGLVIIGPKCGRRSGETARGYATNILRPRYRLVQILLGDDVEVAQ